MGYASVTLEEGGKKVYSITPEGQKYLDDNKSAVEDIFERIQDFGSSFLSESMMEVNRAFGRVARATYTTLPWQSGDKTVTAALKAILDSVMKLEARMPQTAPQEKVYRIEYKYPDGTLHRTPPWAKDDSGGDASLHSRRVWTPIWKDRVSEDGNP